MLCVECDKSISGEDETIPCKQCNGRAHTNCAKSANGPPYTRSTKKPQQLVWTCTKCRTEKDRTGENSDNSELGEDDTINTKSLLVELNNKYDNILKLVSDVPDIKKSVEFLSKQHDDFKQKQEKQDKIIVDLTKQVNFLTTAIGEKDKVIGSLTEKVNDLEQSQLCMQLEIQGIPYKNGENVTEIVTAVAVALGVDTKGVLEAYRSPPTRAAQVPPICVHLSTNVQRSSWITQAKSRRLTTAAILKDNSNIPIYINEKLSQTNKRLLWLTRERCKQLRYKYVWTKQGRIFARKDDTMGVIRVKSEGDVNEKL